MHPMVRGSSDKSAAYGSGAFELLRPRVGIALETTAEETRALLSKPGFTWNFYAS